MSFPGINLNHAVLTAAAAQVGVPRRHEVMGLPKGWIREEMPRYADMAIFGGSGSSNGRGYDTAYFSPQGHMITTKAELAEALGNKYDLTAFDFQTGKINHALLNKVMQQQELQQKAQRQQHHHHQRSSSHSNGGRKGASHQRQNSSSSYHNGGGGASSSPATVVSAPAPSVVPVKPSSSVSKSVAPALAVPTQDTTLVPPIRQTASIFKQPVSLVKNTRVSVL